MKALLLAVALVLVVGIATSHADPSAVLHGCVRSRSGVLRIDDTCRAGESPIDWNQQGPAGPPAPALQVKIISGSYTPAENEMPTWRVIDCPEGMTALAASSWFSTDSSRFQWVPAEISEDGPRSYAEVDWSEFAWDLGYRNATVVWNVTCGGVN